MVNNVIASVENEVSITAYVSDEASRSDIDKVMDCARGPEESVASVGFTTKEQALQNFQRDHAPTSSTRLTGPNPLPASIDVELSDPQMVEQVAERPGLQLDVRHRSATPRAILPPTCATASRRSSACSR